MIPLRRLSLRFCDYEREPGKDFKLLEWTGFAEILRLLQHANLQEIALGYLDSIPLSLPQITLPTVKVLRLAGSCSFKTSVLSILALLYPAVLC